MRGLIESMGINRFILLKKTHFAYAFLHRNMFRVLVSFWVFLSKLIRSFFRFSTSRFLEGSDSNIDDFNEIQSSDHVDEGNRETKSSPMVASTSKNEFLCSTGISGFVEEPETKSFTVHAFFMGSNDYVEAEKTEETNAVFEEKTEECALRFSFFEFEKQIEVIKQEEPVEDYVGRSSVESSVEKQVGDMEGNEHVADVFESIVVDKCSGKCHKDNTGKEIHECNTRISDHKELTIFEEPVNDSEEDLSAETESIASPEKTIEPNMQDEEEEEEEEEEDDDLIDRLKMEVKIARAGGLATILEDFESPKMVQELGPLKIDEKYDHKHHMGEIQKVYKSYSDKMRKLDILNSQTMHAISLLKLKDVPIQVSTLGKSSAAPAKSLHKALSFKQRKAEAEPAMKLIRDLHKDFETVYVGQICLSWAILHWQFGQVKKLLDCDNSLAIHHYNQVAEEFQHFQVLLQRFLEDEPFRTGHRVENYTYSRCSVRHLLQVPVIKDDCSKCKDDAISCEMLKDIIEESLLVFREFLRADKDEANSTSKALRSQVAPHEPIDFEFLMDVKTHLHKKEKRLKEIQRGTNCIIKKFQRQEHQGNLLDYALFIAQVELKLVSRVLNVSKISTDQLAWCHEKLQRIRFSSRKIEIEPSFTLFPC